MRVMDVMRAMSVMRAMCVKRVLRVMRVYPSESRTQICLPFPTERVDFGDNEFGYRFWTWQEAFGKPMLVRSYITAFKEKASKADSVAKASKRRASSLTKHFPLAPDGTLKKFGLQWSHCRLYQ